MRSTVRSSSRIRYLWVVSTVFVVGTLGAGCPSQSPPPSGSAINLQLIAEGFTSPLRVIDPNDGSGRLLIVDQIGVIRVLNADGSLAATPFLDIRDRLVTLDPIYDERGLLGLALHPSFATNGRLFVFYSAPKGGDIPATFDSEVRVSEFALVSGDANQADPASERIVLRVGKPQGNHNGGELAFGFDGKLYISIGDGGNANDVGDGHTSGIGNAQDKSKLLGKILRIDVDGAAPYVIPIDNPFVADLSARREIFAYGLRNPFRFSFDQGGQHRLFAGDVGQDLFEEVDLIVAGGNYGWNRKEALSCFNPQDNHSPLQSCSNAAPDGSTVIDPIVQYAHSTASGPSGEAIVGGFVYRGSAIPFLAGKYVFGDYTLENGGGGSIFVATEANDGTWSLDELAIAGANNGRIGRFVLGFGQDAAGEVYVLSSANGGPTGQTGRVFKIVQAPN